MQPPCSVPAAAARYPSFATEYQWANEGRHHDPHRIQIHDRHRRVHAPGLQRPARGFPGAIERQEAQAFPALREDVRHGPDQPAGSDLRSGRQALRRGGRHWRHVDAEGRPGLPDRHQRLQPLHGRVQRPRGPRAARWHEGDSRRQPAEHDRQHRRQLRPDRPRLHRSDALRVDRDGRLLARDARRSARNSSGQPRWLDDQRRQPQPVARDEPAALHQGHQSRRPPTRSRAACSTR